MLHTTLALTVTPLLAWHYASVMPLRNVAPWWMLVTPGRVALLLWTVMTVATTLPGSTPQVVAALTVALVALWLSHDALIMSWMVDQPVWACSAVVPDRTMRPLLSNAVGVALMGSGLVKMLDVPGFASASPLGPALASAYPYWQFLLGVGTVAKSSIVAYPLVLFAAAAVRQHDPVHNSAAAVLGAWNLYAQWTAKRPQFPVARKPAAKEAKPAVKIEEVHDWQRNSFKSLQPPADP